MKPLVKIVAESFAKALNQESELNELHEIIVSEVVHDPNDLPPQALFTVDFNGKRFIVQVEEEDKGD